PRSIQIDRLELRRCSDNEIEFEGTCSRGTHLRTLAADIGAGLGCGAHLLQLRRLSCDHLSLTQATNVDELEGAVAGGNVPLITLANALSHFPAVTWDNRS